MRASTLDLPTCCPGVHTAPFLLSARSLLIGHLPTVLNCDIPQTHHHSLRCFTSSYYLSPSPTLYNLLNFCNSLSPTRSMNFTRIGFWATFWFTEILLDLEQSPVHCRRKTTERGTPSPSMKK